jgi:phosphohistidine phosphatase
MKSVLLVRHAKSSWDFDVEDFERSLNHRGKTDAPVMAKRLINKEIQIDVFISSPAKRALSTAALFAEAFEVKTETIFIVPSLYEPAVQAFYTAINSLDDIYKITAVFSHNPAITDFANQLTSVRVDDMPTCAIFAVKADIKSWKEFTLAPKQFWFFDYPKAD